MFYRFSKVSEENFDELPERFKRRTITVSRVLKVEFIENVDEILNGNSMCVMFIKGKV